jgi:hypothetical protein
MVKPISPNEVVEQQEPEIPDGVIEVFNEFIAKEFKNGKAVIEGTKILAAIALRCHISKGSCVRNGWLDVDSVFQKAGWVVKGEHDREVGAVIVFTKKEG